MKNNTKFTIISLIIIGVICFVVWVAENGSSNNDQSAPDANIQQSQ